MQRTGFRIFVLRRSVLFLTTILVAVGFGSFRLLIAQDAKELVGQWQGTTEGGKPGRVVLKVEPANGSSLRGIAYLLDGDNAAWPHATTTFTRQGPDVAFVIANLQVNYEGKLGGDGSSMNGAWKQGEASVPLKLTHVSGDAAWEIPSTGRMMAKTADPSFDVATIRPADPNDHGRGFQLFGERLHIRNETLEDIIAVAYNIHRRQLLETPSWFQSEHWEIDGIADTPGAPSLTQMRAMYRKLLQERFGLKLEAQKREIPVYAIEAGKDGPKLTRSVADADGLPDSTGNVGGLNDMRYTNMTMEEFAGDLAMVEDRPVVNHTALPGRFDFRLRWSSSEVASTDPDAPPGLARAMQEQLGLRLLTTRATTEVYVVAHVERPSAN